MKRNVKENLAAQWKSNRAALTVWLLLRVVVIGVLVRSVMLGYWDSAFICLLVLFLFMLPVIIEKRLGVSFPTGLQIVIMAHIFAAEILGEIGCYYVRVSWWDTLVHTVWGFLCAAIGYALVDILNRDDSTHFHLSPAFLAVVAFCFSMTIGVLWEFIEYGIDRLFLLDMQKDTVITRFASVLLDSSNTNTPIPIREIADVAVNGESLGVPGYLDIGLYDTMEDLFVNLIGALCFAVIGFFRSRSENAERIAKSFIPRTAEQNHKRRTEDDPLP